MSKQREFLERCYALDNDEDVRSFYDEAAGQYDEILSNAGYVSPRLCARIFSQHFPDREATLIDLGCGTGLLGEAMRALGYDRLDGSDFSAEMLAEAGRRGCYARLSLRDLNQSLEIADRAYAGALSAGVFGQHVGPAVLDEALRIVESGGGVCFSVNERAFDDCGFRDKVDELQNEGKATCLSLTKEAYHVNEAIEGWVCVLRRR